MGLEDLRPALKWNRSPFTCMTYRTLHAILFYKRVLGILSLRLCNKALPNVLIGRLAGPCHTSGCSSGAALPGSGQPGWLPSLLDQWARQI